MKTVEREAVYGKKKNGGKKDKEDKEEKKKDKKKKECCDGELRVNKPRTGPGRSQSLCVEVIASFCFQNQK